MAKSKKAPYQSLTGGKAPRIDRAVLKHAALKHHRQEASRQLQAEVQELDYRPRKNPYKLLYRDVASRYVPVEYRTSKDLRK